MINIIKYTIALQLILFSYSHVLASQTNESYRTVTTVNVETLQPSERDNMWSLLKSSQHDLQKLMQEQRNLQQIHQIMTHGCELPLEELTSGRLRALRAEEAQVKDRTALSLRGGYANRTVIDDGESNAYLELDWDVLHNGYLENRKQHQALNSEVGLEEIRQQELLHEKELRCRHYQLSEKFIGIKNQLLNMKLALMQAVNPIERRAYFKGWSYLEDTFIAESEISLIEMELDYLRSNNRFERAAATIINLPVIDVDFAQLTKIIDGSAINESKLTQQQALINKQQDARYQDRLQFYVRKDFDVGGSSGNAASTVGLRFVVPFDREDLDNQRNLKRLSLQQQTRLQNWERMIRTRKAYEQLRDQQENVIRQQYRYLTSYERLRRTLVQRRLEGDMEIAEAIIRMRTLMDTAIELVRVKEELYYRVNELFRVASVAYQPELIRQVSLPQEDYRARVGERSAYLWSDFFNKTDNSDLLDLLFTKGMERVVLSLGNKTDHYKAKNFITAAQQRGMVVEIMVGSNEWSTPKQHQEAASTVKRFAELTGAIHLDVEPHVLPNYRDNQRQNLANYLAMLKGIREALGEKQLSVSVPTHWPDEVYTEINTLADQIYLMSYEANDLQRQRKRLERLFKVLDKDKCVVVLNIKEFDDEWAMESLIEQLNQSMGVTKFGLHHMGNFVR